MVPPCAADAWTKTSGAPCSGSLRGSVPLVACTGCRIRHCLEHRGQSLQFTELRVTWIGPSYLAAHHLDFGSGRPAMAIGDLHQSAPSNSCACTQDRSNFSSSSPQYRVHLSICVLPCMDRGLSLRRVVQRPRLLFIVGCRMCRH